MAIKTGLGWKDIDTVILGNIPLHITEIRYKVTNPKVNRYGRGNKPVARSGGNKEYEVTMVLGIEECIQIERAVIAKYGSDFDPTDLAAFDIPVSYDNGEEVKVDIIKDFQFNEWSGGASQGDAVIDIPTPGIASDIKFGVPI